MHLDDLYPSKWINAESLTEGDLHLTIRELLMHIFRDDDEASPILYFEEAEKGLPLNVTNARAIGELHGPETDNWPGKRITIYRTEVEFGGKTTWGVRVRLTIPEATPVLAENDIPF